MDQKEKTQRELQAMEEVKRAKARLAKVRREDKKNPRKEQDHHKFMMGGIIIKYFPDAYDFTELEMNRIIACAFASRDVKNMISAVVRERSCDEINENNTENEKAGEENA